MAQCPHCNRPVKATANFCGYCGYALRGGALASPPQTPPQSQPMQPFPTGSPGDKVQKAAENTPRHSWDGEPPSGTTPPHAFDIRSNTTGKAAPTTAPAQKQKLFIFAALFAAVGLLLIFVVAPEYTSFRRMIFDYGVREYEPEYWMAMVGGGISLLLAGMFLLKAITFTGR